MKRKNEIMIFIIIFIFSLIVCSAFFTPHYTHDTYKIMKDGYNFYSCDKFMREARPITGMLTMLIGYINVSIDVSIVISFILSIAILSFTVLELYKMLKKTLGNISRIKEIVLMLISYITVFGYLTIEHILFFEACIMSLGILLSVLACKIYIDKEKYKEIKSIILLFIACFCYQGSIAIFPIIILTYYAIMEPLNFKEYIKLTIKSAVLYGLLMFSTIIYAKLIFGDSRIQMGLVKIDFAEILEIAKQLVIYSLDVLPPFIHLSIIVLTIGFILFANKENNIKTRIILLFKYLIIIIGSISICIMPFIIGSGLSITARMCIAYGNTIGISLLFIYNTIAHTDNDKKFKNIFIYTLILIVFILNAILYYTLTNQHLKINQMDKEICIKINDIIEEYEKANNIKVTKIIGIYNSTNEYPKGFIKNEDYNQRGTDSWALRETIIYYTKRKMRYTMYTEELYDKALKNKYSTEISEGKVLFYDDIVIFHSN